MRLRPEISPFPRLLVWPLLAVAAFALFWLRTQPDLVLRAAHCPLKDTTGIPCPTCGGTHASVALARLDLAEAWTANPLIVLLAVGFAVWALMAAAATFVPRWRVTPVLVPREKKAARVLAATLVLLGWSYQLLH